MAEPESDDLDLSLEEVGKLRVAFFLFVFTMNMFVIVALVWAGLNAWYWYLSLIHISEPTRPY